MSSALGSARTPASASSGDYLLDVTGVVQPAPNWFGRLVTPAMSEWIEARLDPSALRFVWRIEDPQVEYSRKTANRSRDVTIFGLLPNVRLEILANIAADAIDRNRATPTSVRSLVRAATEGEARSLQHIDSGSVAQLPGTLLRRWQERLAIADADPDKEWLRDDVRLRVLRPRDGRGLVLRMGEIRQPWLRDVITLSIQSRIHDVSPHTVYEWSREPVKLSRFLATRTDHGLDPRRLNRLVMDQFVAALRRDPELTAGSVDQILSSLSSMLTTARAMGHTDRHHLPSDFRVRPDHRIDRRDIVREDRGFPDATFRFLMGADDLFGSRVLDLIRSIPRDEFQGEVFAVALQLGASFGRRPQELCSLGAHRIRVEEAGKPELLYDNFKSGRERVWLPIDARAADVVAPWIIQLRQRYPATPFESLALLPKYSRNQDGTRPLQASVLSQWFRTLTIVLEQAIVMGHIHSVTGASLEVMCNARVGDLDHTEFRAGSVSYSLPAEVAQVAVDYRSAVCDRLGGRMYTPADLAQLPLFNDPFRKAGGQDRRRIADYGPISPHRFNPLGDGWLKLAAQYRAGGIPGQNLGERRVDPMRLQMRLFRHTYLQHLVNLGTDIFLVQELADHGSVQTTIDSYVRVQDEKLREAVEELAKHRMTSFGFGRKQTMTLPSITTRDVGTNDCTNPQVLSLGKEGCDSDRMCYGCSHFSADPSNIPDIKAEIHTCNLSLARLDAEGGSASKPHHVAVLRERRTGWQEMLDRLNGHLQQLDLAERESIETASQIVREFRNRVRAGGLNFGGGIPND